MHVQNFDKTPRVKQSVQSMPLLPHVRSSPTPQPDFSHYARLSRMVINVKKGRALTLPSRLPLHLGGNKYKKQPSPLRYPLSSVPETCRVKNTIRNRHMEFHWVNGIDESPFGKKIDFEIVNVARRL